MALIAQDIYSCNSQCKSEMDPEEFRRQLPERMTQLPPYFDMLFVGTCSEDTYMRVYREHKQHKVCRFSPRGVTYTVDDSHASIQTFFRCMTA